MAKTPEQRIADLEAQLARAKEQARKQRTRRLIQAGAFFEPFLSEWEALPEATRWKISEQVGARVRGMGQGEAPAQP